MNGVGIRNDDIGPNDVLCGRGSRSNHNPGNAAFLGIVETYLSEYYSNRTRKEKQRIAAEIVHHVRNNVDPPGRFLARVDGSDMWHMVDDETELEKVKQALRNLKKTRDKTEREEQKHVEEEGLGHEGSEHKNEDQGSASADATFLEDDSLSDDLRGLIDALPDDWEGLTDATSAGVTVEGVNPESVDLGGLSDAPIETFASLNVEQPTDLTPSSIPHKREEGKEEDNAPGQRRHLLNSISIAQKLTTKIRESHDAGVAYYRTQCNANDKVLSGEDILSDLTALGSELCKLFAGVDASGYEMSSSSNKVDESTKSARVKKRGRGTDHGAYDTLRGLGLPLSLCILVSSLMDAKKSNVVNRYKDMKEVEEDLKLMTIDPDLYLFDACQGPLLLGKLDFRKGKLYGREQQSAELMNTFDRVVASGAMRELVLISGCSGTGKSILVEQLRQPLLQRRGHFISIKFDEQGQVQPMSIIFSAFNDFCNDLLKGDKEIIALVRASLRKTLGANINALTDLIPSLTNVVGEPTSALVQVEGKEVFYRLLFCFRLFVRAITSPLHPIIVLLDDLQWADKASLEFLFMTIMGSNVPSLLFVGCCRSNEVGPDHPLKSEIQKISSFGVDILPISLESIDRKSVNALVSDTLHLLPRVAQPLADIVHAKTSGNPMFAVQFLHSLCDENMLRYSASSRRWEWDVESIQAKDIADNVVDLMTQKMLKLDPDVQWLLKVAACLGSRSEASTLKLLSSNDDDDGSGILPFFDLAVSEGLMIRMGSCYKFSHDQIQQAAYSLIPEGDRDALHLRIGRIFWKKAELNKVIFIVVDQLQRGSNLMTDRDEKVEFARLCLMAGRKAMTLSAFLQALMFLLQGSMMLDESDWVDHYDLSLALFTYCAEAHYVTGNYDGVILALNPVLAKGSCLQDKLGSYYTLLYSLGAQGKQLDAIKCGLEVLELLGESFPMKPDKLGVETEFRRTRDMLQRKSFEDIVQMNETKAVTTLAIMKILKILSRFAFQVNQPLNSLMGCRMLQLSLTRGVCRETPTAFTVFGLTLCARGELDQASRCGQLALSLLVRSEAKDYQNDALVYTTVYGILKPFSSPMQANLPLLSQGHEVGMSMGDIEGASCVATFYVINAFQSGIELAPLAEKVKAYVQEMKEHKHHMLWMTLPYYQAILNLMGNSEDPTNLTGDAMNQQELLSIAFENQLTNVTDKINLLCMYLAYMFRRYDDAAELFEQRLEFSKLRPNRPDSLVFESFYTGLLAVAMAHKAKGEECKKWRGIALEALDKMKIWAANSSWNFQHKLDLLNAETAFYLDGDVVGATVAYDNAIRIAGEHGFTHEKALACERAGVFHSKTSAGEIATQYFERADIHYLEWGAKKKAEDVFARSHGQVESVKY